MSKKEIKRLVILNIPYLILGLLATNLGEAWRLAEGTDISDMVKEAEGFLNSNAFFQYEVQ